MLVFLIYFICVVKLFVFLLLAQFAGESEDCGGWIGGFAFFLGFTQGRENSAVVFMFKQLFCCRKLTN